MWPAGRILSRHLCRGRHCCLFFLSLSSFPLVPSIWFFCLHDNAEICLPQLPYLSNGRGEGLVQREREREKVLVCPGGMRGLSEGAGRKKWGINVASPSSPSEMRCCSVMLLDNAYELNLVHSERDLQGNSYILQCVCVCVCTSPGETPTPTHAHVT